VEEVGVIEAIEGTKAKVRLPGGSGCSHCSSRSVCVVGSGGGRVLEAENEAGGSVGDVVKVVIDPGSVVLGAFLLYISPVLATILTYLLAYWAIGSRGWATTLSLAALFGSFLALRPLERWSSSGRHGPRVAEVVGSSGGGSGLQNP